MSYPFIIQGSNLTVVIDGTPHTISNTHVTFEKVKEAIKAGDWDKVKDIIEPKKVVLNYGQGNVSIQGTTLYWKGKPWHNAMATRMIQMLTDGFPVDPMVKFMENLMQNPSNRSVQELYGFLEKNNLPITPDGCFLAYKKVRADFKDVHSGTFDNSPGKVVEMLRNEVDDVSENTCSHGLHFCSKEYLQHFGGERIVIVKINPRDVVSIPKDYNESKGRCCRYEVISELGVDPDKAFVKPVQNDAGKVYSPSRKYPKLGKTTFYLGYSDGFYGDEHKENMDDKYYEGYDKGIWDSDSGADERYRFEDVGNPEDSSDLDIVESVQKAPTNKDIKLGKTDFYRGYSDGFYGHDFFGLYSQEYTEGYDKGEDDAYTGKPERYRFSGDSVSPAPWPFPIKR